MDFAIYTEFTRFKCLSTVIESTSSSREEELSIVMPTTNSVGQSIGGFGARQLELNIQQLKYAM